MVLVLLFIYLYVTGYQIGQPAMITVKLFSPFSFDGTGAFINLFIFYGVTLFQWVHSNE